MIDTAFLARRPEHLKKCAKQNWRSSVIHKGGDRDFPTFVINNSTYVKKWLNYS